MFALLRTKIIGSMIYAVFNGLVFRYVRPTYGILFHFFDDTGRTFIGTFLFPGSKKTQALAFP